MRKLLSAIFILLISITMAYAQQGVRYDFLGFRLGFVQVNPNYDSLTLDYTDQASKPHEIIHGFSLRSLSPMYGGEMLLSAIRTKKSIYFDGATIGYYRAKKSEFVYMSTGIGHEFLAYDDDLSIIPTLCAGFSFVNQPLGSYQTTNGLPLNVQGKDLSKDFSVSMTQFSVFMMPKISLIYPISFTFNLSFTASYRLNLSSHERILFAYYSKSGTAYAHDSVGSGIQNNGQYITGKCINTSGLNLSIGLIYYLEDQ